MFDEQVAPRIQEQYAGTGNIESGARRKAMSGAATQFGEGQAQNLMNLIMQGQQFGRQALGAVPGIQQAELSPIASAMQYMNTPATMSYMKAGESNPWASLAGTLAGAGLGAMTGGVGTAIGANIGGSLLNQKGTDFMTAQK